MLETLPVFQCRRFQALGGEPLWPGLGPRQGVQQPLRQQRREVAFLESQIGRAVGAQYRADALRRQVVGHDVLWWRAFGEQQAGVQAGGGEGGVVGTGRQMQIQLRQILIEPIQPWNEPARHQTAGATQHEGPLAIAGLEFGADLAQPLEDIATHLAQSQPGLGQRQAAALATEQGHAQLFLQRTYLPAHGSMGHMQLVTCTTHSAQAGSGLEGAQGIQGW